jgi:hypothetical protein
MEGFMFVELHNEEFGAEMFYYGTEAEALAGFERLKKAAIKHTKKDGLTRSINLVTKSFTTCETEKL